jgi:DNA-binding Lrp family transcriptional regulator
MTTTPDSTDAKLLVVLQKGLPLVPRPFARLGDDLGLTEEAVLARVRGLFETGVARRFGAVFDSRSLHYESTLCAAEVPADDLVAAAARIAPHPGITHCYEREGHPNLWFTLTAPAAELKPELARVAAALGRYGVLNLPALKKFKVEAVFGQGEESPVPEDSSPAPVATPIAPLTERERQVVRRLQANITVTEDPFGLLARELGVDPAELLELLKRWEHTGVIRRIGFVLRHRQLGFSANSMCVWAVTADRIAAVGESLARSPHVTHCYERPSFPDFPFNLYAMIHAKSRDEAIGIFRHLGDSAGLPEGRMLWSVREFKKSSPIFFCEPPPALGKPGSA